MAKGYVQGAETRLRGIMEVVRGGSKGGHI